MNEKELLALLLNPDSKNEGFKLLLEEYQQKIYWVIRKIVIDHEDANDVTQDVFVKIFSNIDKFRKDAGLYTWIYRIAVNESLTFLNKRKRFSTKQADEYLENSLKAGEYVDGDEISIKLQKALLSLPEKQRVVFNLKYFEEMKYEDMSKITDTSVGGLKASYHHAVKKIEEYLISH